MLFNVPQFIDIEDKIVGPLTAKQLGWLGLGGVVLLVLWKYLDFEAFLIGAFITGGIFGAMAFYRPYGQPLILFLMSSVYYMFRPKMYIWRRLPEKIEIPRSQKTKQETIIPQRKKISEKKIQDLSNVLDLRK